MGVQNRTNPIEKQQTKSTQTKTAKNRILFGGSLFCSTAWFG
jgi:hypothetical protein